MKTEKELRDHTVNELHQQYKDGKKIATDTLIFMKKQFTDKHPAVAFVCSVMLREIMPTMALYSKKDVDAATAIVFISSVNRAAKVPLQLY